MESQWTFIHFDSRLFLDWKDPRNFNLNHGPFFSKLFWLGVYEEFFLRLMQRLLVLLWPRLARSEEMCSMGFQHPNGFRTEAMRHASTLLKQAHMPEFVRN